MFGTACVAAAACIALFAIITAIGLVVSVAYREEPHHQQPVPSQDAPAVAVAHLGQPPPMPPGRPRSRKYQLPRGSDTVASEIREAPPRAL